MNLRHVYGKTYVAEATTALIPIYKLNDRDVVLFDTGYAKLDRSGLTNLLEENGLHPRGVICSHRALRPHRQRPLSPAALRYARRRADHRGGHLR